MGVNYIKAKNRIGEKYNSLTIIDIDYPETEKHIMDGKHYGVYVKCQCDCGNIKTYRFNTIQNGHTKSCGCLKNKTPYNFHDLTGKVFGRLTVIGRDEERDNKAKENGKHQNAHWLCKCNCGSKKIVSVTGYQLETGHTQSCGCYASEQIAKRNKKYSTKINSIIDNGDGIILLDDDNNECIIDKEDYSILKNWYWRKVAKRGDINKGYWTTNTKIDDNYTTSIVFIHQIVAEIKYGVYDRKNMMPDHLSRDTNDNRKCNIYLKDNIGNCKNRSLSKANSSGKTGVCKSNNKWSAYITVNYNNINLGEYDNIEDAIQARKEAEKKYGFTCDDIVASYDDCGVAL